MFRYIEALREKPESTRRRYALGISASIIFLIALVWGITLPGRLSEVSQKSDESGPSPLGSLIENIKGGFASVKGGISSAAPAATTESSQASSSIEYNKVIIIDP